MNATSDNHIVHLTDLSRNVSSNHSSGKLRKIKFKKLCETCLKFNRDDSLGSVVQHQLLYVNSLAFFNNP